MAAAQDHDAMVARGKYLVESVSMCQDCHTPKTESGEMDKSKWLKGGALNISAIQPVAKWHKTAPDLTSSGRLFKRWGVEGLVKFLETGNGPTGHPADPPMPAYRLSHEDAVAVVEYLKTLP
ncbi:MAG TPA: c-type cytochrome [Bryobacterales bacterium]|nr:c-type cytochrome [Bryobacterales bacterium]